MFFSLTVEIFVFIFFYSAHNSLYIAPIVNHGNDAQKEQWVSDWAASKIGCFGLSEPGNGSDAGAASTTAVETENGFKLNGTKMWITNAYEAEASIVFATTDKSLKHKVRIELRKFFICEFFFLGYFLFCCAQ